MPLRHRGRILLLALLFAFRENFLPLFTDRRIVALHLQNQVPGLEPWISLVATYGAFALFLCRAHGHILMVGPGGGAAKRAGSH